jgi:hypothetical protein
VIIHDSVHEDWLKSECGIARWHILPKAYTDDSAPRKDLVVGTYQGIPRTLELKPRDLRLIIQMKYCACIW